MDEKEAKRDKRRDERTANNEERDRKRANLRDTVPDTTGAAPGSVGNGAVGPMVPDPDGRTSAGMTVPAWNQAPESSLIQDSPAPSPDSPASAGRQTPDSPVLKDSYHHGDLRRALILQGRRLLILEGLASFSLRRVASSLGVSHAAPYRHFASREELLAAIVNESNSGFQRALSESVAGMASGEDALMALGEAYVRFYLDNPEVLSLFAVLPAQLAQAGETLRDALGGGVHQTTGPGEGSGLPEAYGDPAFMLLRNIAQGVMDRFPGLEEKDVLLGYWAKVHGLATILALQPGWFGPEDLTAGIRRVLRAAF